MRRLVVATALVTTCGLSCVTQKVAEPTLEPYPVYTVRPRPPDAVRPPPASPPAVLPRQSTEAPPAGWFPKSGRISSRWATIVIHHSATASGGAKAFDRYHRQQNGWDELGYHFVIGNGTDTPDGSIEVGSRWHKQKHGAHCKTPDNYYNEHGIGICLVGNFDETRPTARQMASLNRLLRYLCNTCRIPPARVVTHGALTGRTRCPGSRFSLAAARAGLGAPARTAQDRPSRTHTGYR